MSGLVATKSYTNPLLILTAAGAGAPSQDFDGSTHRGILVYINITALAGTAPTLTVTIQGKDDISGTYYTILASAAINATGFTVLKVFPSAPATANVSANDTLPKTFRINTTIGGSAGQAVTATIAANLV